MHKLTLTTEQFDAVGQAVATYAEILDNLQREGTYSQIVLERLARLREVQREITKQK